MINIFTKIGMCIAPAFIACHLIKENKKTIKSYCPVVKYKSHTKEKEKEKVNKYI